MMIPPRWVQPSEGVTKEKDFFRMIIIPQDTPQKQCSKCPSSYPATPEFYSRDRSKKDGLHTTCKACEKACKKVYAEIHKEEIREHCRIYRESHKVEIAEGKRRYQQESEHHKAYQKQYHQEHKDELAKQSQQYYQVHRDERCEYSRQYLQTVQGRMVDKAHKHKRKAQKRASKGTYTPQQLQEQMHRQKSRCYYCKVKLGKIYHADHVVPLARGGTNDIHNIVLTCPTCNMRKKAKLPHEWFEGGRLL